MSAPSIRSVERSSGEYQARINREVNKDHSNQDPAYVYAVQTLQHASYAERDAFARFVANA